jgi:hypothetical protein
MDREKTKKRGGNQKRLDELHDFHVNLSLTFIMFGFD